VELEVELPGKLNFTRRPVVGKDVSENRWAVVDVWILAEGDRIWVQLKSL
jgi:hypothetical protein